MIKVRKSDVIPLSLLVANCSNFDGQDVQQALLDYKQDNNLINKQRIIDSLLITKEFLAFKYWVIKDDPDLYNDFRNYMTWNN